MGRTTSAPHICRDRPVLADTGGWPWQLFGFGVDSARRPRWRTVSRTKGCVVCLAAWRSTTVAEHPSVIQGLGRKAAAFRLPNQLVLSAWGRRSALVLRLSPIR